MNSRRHFFVLFLLCCSLPAGSRAQGYLHASGTSIVDGNGHEVILRGIGLGGWLVPEGYMLHTPASSPTDIQNAIINVVGAANADQFFQLYRQNYVSRTDIDSIARWGFNSIRLPMHFALFTPRDQPGVYLESGFALVDSLLSWCEANHLYLILDLHCAPGGQNSANISDYIAGQPSLWESDVNKNRTVDLWKRFAQRYATKEWIGGYDLLNETVWSFPGGGNAPLRELFVRITDSIRTVDRNHILFIEGNTWATDFTDLIPPWDPNMVYSFHKYWNTNDPNSIGGYLGLMNSSNVPLWLGESGENSNNWFTDCIKLMESYKIGWSWWPHKKIESIAGPLSAYMDPGYNNLLKYWNGQVPKPSVADAVAALTAQAENLKIGKCEYHPDVIDAIVRQPYVPGRKPYASNTIPGPVYAVDYDMGQNGVAYRDQEYQNTGSGGWNTGGAYRNDGVDIESSGGLVATNGYNVGWTAKDEFLTYTINATQGGTYQIELHYASNQAGGNLFVRVDNSPVTLAILPSTGGWQTWQTMVLGQKDLTAGAHDLRLDIIAPGFNIGSLSFTLVSDVAEGGRNVPARFALHPNYPNPFNPSTVIRYELPSGAKVRLAVYDVLGREVGLLVNEEKSAGVYSVRWDAAAGMASGFYFYRLEAGAFRDTKGMLFIK